MCGINGLIGIKDAEKAKDTIGAMNACLAHRGPDADGIWYEEGTTLGHRRLSIIDTTSDSNQPFVSHDGLLILVFNGELYNYLEIKAQLPDYPFKTAGDTEVVIAAYEKWGRAALQMFNGMFAFALHDKRNNETTIVRDRLGIKPLYYFEDGPLLAFSSEVRSLLKSGLFQPKLDQEGLVDYLRYQTVHQPRTIIEQISVLPAGHFMVLEDDGLKIEKYWDFAEMADMTYANAPIAEIKQEVYSRLFQSVSLRMRADVPFGAFLSGGIDSSIIVGLMSQISTRPVKTFSVTFDEGEFSEAPYSRMIAKRFDTDHTEINLSPEDFLNIIPSALKAMDHPSGDGPNTYLVSQVTKEAGVTMAMSGLGGDEVFAGYDIFKRHMELQDKKWLMSFPKILRNSGGKLYKLLKPGVASDKIASILDLEYLDLEYTYPLSRQVLLDDSIKKLLSFSKLPTNRVMQILAEHVAFDKPGGGLPELSKVSFGEMATYMQHTLLRDADQMSMAHALEVRVPFLDHRLVELVAGISDQHKFPHTPKQLLVESVGNLIPSEIVNRPKMGFTFPWPQWMKGKLQDFCATHMQALSKRSAFNEAQTMRLWDAFLQNDPKVTWSRIWYLVVLEYWLSENGVDEA